MDSSVILEMARVQQEALAMAMASMLKSNMELFSGYQTHFAKMVENQTEMLNKAIPAESFTKTLREQSNLLLADIKKQAADLLK